MWVMSPVQSCECWAPYFDPTEARRTTGSDRAPADIACHLAIWLKISSPARPMKSAYMSSTRLRPPSIAWPTAAATMAASEIGELNSRWCGQDVREAAVDAEGAAPFAALLAPGDEAVVVDHVVEDRLGQRVAERDGAKRRQFRAVLAPARPRLAGKPAERGGGGGIAHARMPADRERRFAVREHEPPDPRGVARHVHGRRERGVDDGARHRLDPLRDLLAHGVGLTGAKHARALERLGEKPDRVRLFPELDLLPRAVGVGVGRGVPAEPVAFDVEKRGAFARKEELALARHRVGHGERVRPVHRLGMERGGRDARTDARRAGPSPSSRPRSGRPWRRSCS